MKLYYRATVNKNFKKAKTKSAWYWHKNRHEDSEMKPHSQSHLTFDKGAETYTGEKSLFNKCGRGTAIYIENT
jgi:hypothetical protein